MAGRLAAGTKWGDPDAPAVVCWPGLGLSSAYFHDVAKLGVPVDVDFKTWSHGNREASIDTATWDEAFAQLCEHFGNWTPSAELAARDILHEQDGRIRESGSPEAAAGMLLDVRAGDPLERGLIERTRGRSRSSHGR